MRNFLNKRDYLAVIRGLEVTDKGALSSSKRRKKEHIFLRNIKKLLCLLLGLNPERVNGERSRHRERERQREEGDKVERRMRSTLTGKRLEEDQGEQASTYFSHPCSA